MTEANREGSDHEPGDNEPKDGELGEEPSLPVRELRDPRALRAMAHPVRLRLLQELGIRGPATATELAEVIGQSPANCSWHLRQLARYGFIEEAEGGKGRQRPWRLVAQSTRIPAASTSEPEFARASDALVEMVLGLEAEALRSWFVTQYQESAQWRDSSFSSTSFDYMTAEELSEFKRELHKLLQRSLAPRIERIDPAKRPPQARPVRMVFWGFPADPPAGAPGDAPSPDDPSPE